MRTLETLYLGFLNSNKLLENGNCLFIYVQTIRFHFSWPIFYILFSVPADALHSKKTIVSNEDNVLELQGFRRQKSGPREKTDERVHGVGSGCEEDTRRSVSAASQRRAVQDSGETLAVSLYFGYSLQLLSDEHEVSIRGFLVEETRRGNSSISKAESQRSTRQPLVASRSIFTRDLASEHFFYGTHAEHILTTWRRGCTWYDRSRLTTARTSEPRCKRVNVCQNRSWSRSHSSFSFYSLVFSSYF